MEVGGWVQVSLGIFLFENRPKIAITSDILEYYTMYIHCKKLLFIMI